MKNKYPFNNRNKPWIKNKNKEMSPKEIMDEISKWMKIESPYNHEFNDYMFYSLRDIMISGYIDKLKYLYNIELEGAEQFRNGAERFNAGREALEGMFKNWCDDLRENGIS